MKPTKSYDELFRLFLAHTDQKRVASTWLHDFISKQSARELFIDVGAGEGTLTEQLQKHFKQTVAIEPNPELSQILQQRTGLKVVSQGLSEISDMPPGDFILCSHVLYLVESAQWVPSIKKMASWLSKTGALVVIHQSRETDCRQMRRYFGQPQSGLEGYMDELQAFSKNGYQIQLEVAPSYITAPDIETAVGIGEFILEAYSADFRLAPGDIRDYIESNFAVENGYRFSCHQDFLVVKRT